MACPLTFCPFMAPTLARGTPGWCHATLTVYTQHLISAPLKLIRHRFNGSLESL